MSNLGDRLQDEIDAILALQTAEEKGTEEGDEWDAEYEGYVKEVQNVFNDAAPDTIRNSSNSYTPIESQNQTTTSTSFSTVQTFQGAFERDIPTDATLKFRLIGRVKNDTSGESTSIVPTVFDIGGSNAITLGDLQMSMTGTSYTVLDSGWVAPSSSFSGTHIFPRDIQMKVSAGTGEIQQWAELKWGIEYP